MTRERKVMSRAELWGGVILAIGILLFVLSAFAVALDYLSEETAGVLDGGRGYLSIGALVILVAGVLWNLRLRQKR